jgi:antitoxin component YwqK of YwqJK toxin-antitoxin module
VGWYPGRQDQYHAFYRNGQLEGEARSWYESGKPKGLAVYQGGKRQGVQRSWHENGGPHLTVEYKGESIVKLDELAADGSRSDSTKSSLEKCRESGTL